MNDIRIKNRIIVLFALLLVSCGDGSVLSNQSDPMDWLFFRGDASLSGYTDVRLPQNPVLLWTFASDIRTVSSPIVKEGNTYWCDRRGLIRGVDLNGKPIFEYDMKTAVEATPLIADSILYIGRIDGKMTAISLQRKEIIWNYETWGQVSATPNLAKFEGRNAIIFGSYDNFLYCLNAETGEELSKFESGYYLNGAAALWKGHVVYGGCDSWVRIVNCQTGVQTDSLLLEAYVPASPAIAGNYCYVGDYSGSIYELRLADGKIVDHRVIATGDSQNGSYVSVPAVSDDKLYFLSGNRYIKAVSRKGGEELWQYMLKGNTGESSPVIAKDKVIICTKTGIISILNAKSGALEWEYDTGEQIVGSPAIIKDYFFVLTSKGTLLCFGKEG